MKTNKILCVTRHTITEKQENELKRIYGKNCIIDQQFEQVSSVDTLLNTCKKNQYTVIMAVLPLPLLEQLLKEIRFQYLDIVVIKSIMCRYWNDDIAKFEFDHFEQIQEIKIISKKL